MAVQIIDIQDYTASMNRTVRMFSGIDLNGVGGVIGLYSGLYLSTTTLTQIDFTATDGNLDTSTVVALYGIKGA